jgi:adenylate cyclase
MPKHFGRFEDMGEQQVKNIARPIRVHRILLGERPSPSEPAIETPSQSPLMLPDKPSMRCCHSRT